MKARIFFFSFCLVTTAVLGQQSGSILIGAASDLKFALDSLVVVFKKDQPHARVDVTYGSSGKLYEQISHGAPFDLFFSADIEYPSILKKKGIAVSEVITYGIGRIVIWSRVTNPAIQGMNTLLDKNIAKISIANPRHAPYGRRAEEALNYYQVYDLIKHKLVFGENISQTAQFVTVGAVEAAIIALSLARSPDMKSREGSYYIIPEEAHQPLTQGFVVLQHAQENATAWSLYRFMQSKKASGVLSHFGFSK